MRVEYTLNHKLHVFDQGVNLPVGGKRIKKSEETNSVVSVSVSIRHEVKSKQTLFAV